MGRGLFNVQPSRATWDDGKIRIALRTAGISQETFEQRPRTSCCPLRSLLICPRAVLSPTGSQTPHARAIKQSLRCYHVSLSRLSPAPPLRRPTLRERHELYISQEWLREPGMRPEDPPKALIAPVGRYSECPTLIDLAALEAQMEEDTKEFWLLEAQNKDLNEEAEVNQASIQKKSWRLREFRPMLMEEVEKTKGQIRERLLAMRVHQEYARTGLTTALQQYTSQIREQFSRIEYDLSNLKNCHDTELLTSAFKVSQESLLKSIDAADRLRLLKIDGMLKLLWEHYASIESVTRDSDFILDALARQRGKRRGMKWTKLVSETMNISNDRTKRFSDLTTWTKQGLRDVEKWYLDMWPSISENLVSREIKDNVKQLLYQIEAAAKKLIQGLHYIDHLAHFARYYSRAARYGQSLSYEPFRHMLDYGRLSQLLGRMEVLARGTRLEAFSYTHAMGRTKQARLLDQPLANELTDRCEILQQYAQRQSIIAKTLFYGILSVRQASPVRLQLRRQQAAVWEPFRVSLEGRPSMRDLDSAALRREVPQLREDHPLFVGLEDCLLEKARHTRDFWLNVDEYIVYNWKSMTYSPPTRTVWRKPASQPSALTPIKFPFSPGPCTPSYWDYNDYRGPKGERIPIFYCNRGPKLRSALSQLTRRNGHNGVVSLDVQCEPAQKLAAGSLRPSFSSRFPVITLASESQIVIIQLGSAPRILQSCILPAILKQILRDPNIIKVGVGMKKICQLFQTYLNVSIAGTCDIGALFSISRPLLRSKDLTLQSMVQRQYNLNLPSSVREATIWGETLNLDRIRNVASAAYASVQLFFDLTQEALSRSPVGQVPLWRCSEDTRNSLHCLLPRVEQKTISLRESSEYVGPLRIHRAGFDDGQMVRRFALTLAKFEMAQRPWMRSMMLPLYLFKMYDTFGVEWQEVEKLQPSSPRNFPAFILEMVTKANLASEPDRFTLLQKMALVQFAVTKKIIGLEAATNQSHLFEKKNSSAKLNELMILIRQKIKAEEWLASLPPKHPLKSSAADHSALVAFVMWRNEEASESNISNLLDIPLPKVRKSIVYGALRLMPGQGGLERVSARDPAMLQAVLRDSSNHDRAWFREATNTKRTVGANTMRISQPTLGPSVEANPAPQIIETSTGHKLARLLPVNRSRRRERKPKSIPNTPRTTKETTIRKTAKAYEPIKITYCVASKHLLRRVQSGSNVTSISLKDHNAIQPVNSGTRNETVCPLHQMPPPPSPPKGNPDDGIRTSSAPQDRDATTPPAIRADEEKSPTAAINQTPPRPRFRTSPLIRRTKIVSRAKDRSARPAHIVKPRPVLSSRTSKRRSGLA